jgi:hypothetical protein
MNDKRGSQNKQQKNKNNNNNKEKHEGRKSETRIKTVTTKG